MKKRAPCSTSLYENLRKPIFRPRSSALPISNRVITLLILLLAALAAVQFMQHLSAGIETYTDYMVDWSSGRERLADGDPFSPMLDLMERHLGVRTDALPNDPNPHPPGWLALALPLSFLPFRVARLLLVFISSFSLLAALLIFARSRGLPRWIAPAALAMPLVHLELLSGQASCIVLLLLVLAWRAVDRERDVESGLWLGLAGAIKLFPLFLLFYLLRTKRFRASASALVFFIGFTIAGAAALGLDRTWRWALDSSSSNLAGWMPASINLSIPGLLSRAIDWPALVLIAIGLGISLVFARRKGWWASTPWMILGAPLGWPHYAVTVLPAVAQSQIGAGALAIIALNLSSWYSISWVGTFGLIILGMTRASEEIEAPLGGTT